MVKDNCSCLETINSFLQSVKNYTENEIYQIISYFLSDFLEKILEENLDEETKKILSQNIYLIDTFLNNNSNILLSYLQTLTKDEFIYKLISLYFNLLLLRGLLNEFIDLLDKTKKKCKELILELSKRGRVDKYYRKIIKNKQRIQQILLNLTSYKTLSQITKLEQTIENIYNDLCLPIKGETLPNLLIILQIGEYLSKLTLLYSKIIILINNIRSIEIEYKKEKEKMGNLVQNLIINMIKTFLEWSDDISVVCIKLNILKNLLKNFRFDKERKKVFKLKLPHKFIETLRLIKKYEDYYKFSVNNLQTNIRGLKCRTIDSEIKSLKKLTLYIESILNEFGILTNNFPFIKNYIQFYDNILKTFGDDFSLINNVINGKLNEILSSENPLISFLNLSDILKCYNIDIDKRIYGLINYYFDFLNKGDDLITDAFIKYLKIQDKLFSVLKFKLNINIDKIINVFRKISKIKKQENRYKILSKYCL